MPVIDPTITRASLGLPEGFVFLFAFDYLSVLKRKNPIGLIEAFCKAFEPGEGPTLVIKSINGERCLSDRERVRFAASARPDIVLIEDYLSVDQTRALTALSDCYVSLHRSEGLGLTMAEAMSLGKPVIATGYSGNLDFMDERTTWLVPYELVPVGKGAAPYSPTANWAEPDLDTAARYMREIFDDPETAAERGKEAQRQVLDGRSLRHTSLYVGSRVKVAEEILAGERELPTLDLLGGVDLGSDEEVEFGDEFLVGLEVLTVAVPPRPGDPDERHPGLDQASGHQGLLAELGRAVGVPDRLRLFRDVEEGVAGHQASDPLIRLVVRAERRGGAASGEAAGE